MSIIDEILKKGSGKTANVEMVNSAEKSIGFAFPELLKSVYTKVANGGVGPGYQILGVDGGHLSEEGETITQLYLELSATDEYDSLWVWPKGTVPFCHWGSSVYSCFDVTKPGDPVVWFDPNVRDMGEPMEQQFSPHRESLESWFRGWLNGEDLRAGQTT